MASNNFLQLQNCQLDRLVKGTPLEMTKTLATSIVKLGCYDCYAAKKGSTKKMNHSVVLRLQPISYNFMDEIDIEIEIEIEEFH